MVALAAGTGCRPVPPVKQGTATPASESAPIPEVYQFLAHPGVGIESVDSLWARLPYDSISLRRDPCFGTCPMYDATLYRGGAARYHGIRFVDQVGGFKGEITLQDYGRLNYLLDRLEFMALPDSFAAAATDLPGMTLTAHRRPEGFKSVHDYGYVGPVELWTLGQVFDGILNRVQWEKTGP
jgi:hypothetical protein